MVHVLLNIWDGDIVNSAASSTMTRVRGPSTQPRERHVSTGTRTAGLHINESKRLATSWNDCYFPVGEGNLPCSTETDSTFLKNAPKPSSGC
jgi:hypothetical protein